MSFINLLVRVIRELDIHWYVFRTFDHQSKEHLNLADSRKTAINDHILSCPTCSNLQYNINSFTILKKCNSDYEAKIHEALLLKRHSPSLNK